MNTRKYPRTLNEAFGPYTSNRIDEDLPMDWQDYLVIAACIVTVSICVSLVLVGVIV